MTTIPASAIVNVLPGVISAGGTGLVMQGLFLTNNPRAPYGAILSFASAANVAAYFGPSSNEAAAAAIYFAGYTNSLQTPPSVLFAAYETASVAAWLRGANMGLTLAALQALTGSLTISVAGTPLTSSTINLSSASSFSNAASIIQAAFTSPAFTVTYDSISGGFLVTSNATGAVAITYATGTLAASLGLTAATGGVLSQGVVADVPGTAMSAIVAQTQNFATFTTLFAPTDAQLIAFGTWNGLQNNRYLYVGWTSSVSAYSNPDTTSPVALLKAANVSGTFPIYAPTFDKAAFYLGYGAAIDYTAPRGRTVAAFRSGPGLTADVTDQTIGAQLTTNGYTFYGAWATANQQFVFGYNGQVTGPFGWVDSYLDQIWMNNGLQLSLMTMLTTLGQIPYNSDGYEMIQAACYSVISSALSFGAIRAGVTLSASQASAAAALVGQDVSQILYARGWYLYVQDPGAQARAARQSPTCIFLYTDGQSVQRITLSSLMVQ